MEEDVTMWHKCLMEMLKGLHSVYKMEAASYRESSETVYVISLTTNRVFTPVKITAEAEVTLKLELSHCLLLFPLTQPQAKHNTLVQSLFDPWSVQLLSGWEKQE